jgi:4-amino-4-deoxy-L-arabinose transferase-like glycosyltransferase
MAICMPDVFQSGASGERKSGAFLVSVMQLVRRVDWLLLTIVVTGLAARIDAVLDWNSISPNSFSALGGDQPNYSNTAIELLRGQGFTWVGRVPGYPAFLAVLLWLTNYSLHEVRILQCLLGISVIILTFNLCNRLAGRRASYLAAAMSAFALPLVRQPVNIMSEVLFTPVLLLVLLLTVKAFEQPALARFAWLGMMIGISDLIRPTLLLLPAAVGVAALAVLPWRLALRYFVCCAALAFVTILPWLIHNRVRHDAMILATSNAFLWQGSPEYYHLIHDQGYTYSRIWGTVLYNGNLPHPMSVSGDRYWTHRALASIRREPLTYIRFAVEKLFTYWVGDSGADWNEGPIFSYTSLVRGGYPPSMAIGTIVARAAPIVAIIGIVILWPLRRRLLPIYLLLVFTTLFHSATHAEARLSEPFLTLLLIIIAGAVARIGELTAMPEL